MATKDAAQHDGSNNTVSDNKVTESETKESDSSPLDDNQRRPIKLRGRKKEIGSVDLDEARAVIVDHGSYQIRAGYDGDINPKIVFPSVVGTPHLQGSVDCYIGHEAQTKHDILNLRYPIDHGIIHNWDNMEKIWHYIFCNELHVSSEDHPVMLTDSECSGNVKLQREKMAQIMFETFRVPGMTIGNRDVLSLYASARTTGVVVKSGDAVSHVVPIYEGYPLVSYPNTQLDVAGRNLTTYLEKLLHDRYPNCSLKYQEVSEIKEKLCYIATSTDSNNNPKSYECPNGEHITIDKERFQCPEVLFNPSLIGISSLGIHELCYESIMKSSDEIHKDLFANIVLAGGNTLFPGIADRLQKEITKLAPSTMTVNVIAQPKRQHAAWASASSFASLRTYPSSFIYKGDYDESGPSVIHRKCF